MKKVGLNLLLAAVAAVFLLASCSSDSDSFGSYTDVELSRATKGAKDWIYFSFEQNREVEVKDYTTDLTWDLAFNATNVRTNGGKSGSGEGGVVDMGTQYFGDVTVAPIEGYTLDEDCKIMNSMPPIPISSTANPLLSKALQMVPGTPRPSFEVNDHVYIVKSAKGYYAKLMITSFYDQKGKLGIVSFRYFYQADGSLSLIN